MLSSRWGVGSWNPLTCLINFHVFVLAGPNVLGFWEMPPSAESSKEDSISLIWSFSVVSRISAEFAYSSSSLVRALCARVVLAGSARIYLSCLCSIILSKNIFLISGERSLGCTGFLLWVCEFTLLKEEPIVVWAAVSIATITAWNALSALFWLWTGFFGIVLYSSSITSRATWLVSFNLFMYFSLVAVSVSFWSWYCSRFVSFVLAACPGCLWVSRSTPPW